MQGIDPHFFRRGQTQTHRDVDLYLNLKDRPGVPR
jgi:hypothetical protein